jgi:N-acetylglutamate synthase-like GNAT family acetyltransferase
MLVREATAAEHAELGELCVRAYAAADGLSESYAARLRDVAARTQTARVLVAEDEGRAIGCVTLILDGGPLGELARAGEAELRMLAVDPASQGHGAGAALVQACVEEARAAGRERMLLSTPRERDAAHRLYARLGFARAPARDWSPVPGVHLLVYTLDLRRKCGKERRDPG